MAEDKEGKVSDLIVLTDELSQQNQERIKNDKETLEQAIETRKLLSQIFSLGLSEEKRKRLAEIKERRQSERLARDAEEEKGPTKIEMPDKPRGIFGAIMGAVVGLVQGLLAGLTATIAKVYAGARIKKAIQVFKTAFYSLEGIFILAKEELVASKLGVSLGKFVTSIKNFFNYFTQPLKDAMKMIGEGKTFTKFIEPVLEAFSGLRKFFKAIGETVGRILVPIFATIEAVIQAVSFFKDAEGSLLNKLVSGLTGAVAGFVDFFVVGLVEFVKKGVSWIAGKLGLDKVEEILDSFDLSELFVDGMKMIAGAIAHPLETFNWMLEDGKFWRDKITSYASELVESFKDLGKFFYDSFVGPIVRYDWMGFFDPLLDKIMIPFKLVGEVFAKMGDDFETGMTIFGDLVSTTLNLIPQGLQLISDGFIKGVELIGTVVSFIVEKIEGTFELFTNVFSMMGEDFSNTFSLVIDSIKKFDPIQMGMELIDTIITGISSMITGISGFVRDAIVGVLNLIPGVNIPIANASIPVDPLKAAKDTGVYEKTYRPLQKSKIDRNKVKDAPVDQLKAIIADDDISKTDRQYIENIINNRRIEETSLSENRVVKTEKIGSATISSVVNTTPETPMVLQSAANPSPSSGNIVGLGQESSLRSQEMIVSNNALNETRSSAVTNNANNSNIVADASSVNNMNSIVNNYSMMPTPTHDTTDQQYIYRSAGTR